MATKSSGTVEQTPSRYKRMTATGPSGKKVRSLNNGDAVARALFGMSRKDVNSVLRSNGMGKWAKDSDKMNAGQHRMVAGNKLRHLVRTGNEVVVGPYRIKALDQKHPTAEEALGTNAPAAKRKKRA